MLSGALPAAGLSVQRRGAGNLLKRILVVSDAWHPQVNGVARTLDTVAGLLRARVGSRGDRAGPVPDGADAGL